MDRKAKECAEKLRQLVSDIQGAPYPGDNVEGELYKIWYEHVQRSASEAFEFLDANFPKEQQDISKTLKKILN